MPLCPSAEVPSKRQGFQVRLVQQARQKYFMRLTADQLQNELLIIAHHLDDIDEGLKDKDIDYVKKSLHDIREVIERLGGFLSKEQAAELERMSEQDRKVFEISKLI